MWREEVKTTAPSAVKREEAVPVQEAEASDNIRRASSSIHEPVKSATSEGGRRHRVGIPSSPTNHECSNIVLT